MEVTLLGNILNRYKVNDLAKDFGMQTKQIVEILGKYFDKPKKSGQNLSDHELTVVFEYLTQNNQVSNIQSIYADVPAAEQAAPAPQAKSAPAGKPEQPAQQQKKGGRQQPQKGKSQTPPAKQQSGAPQGRQQPQQQKGQSQQPQQQPVASRVPKTKVVDTRKATNVNLDKYDEKLGSIGTSKTVQVLA